MDAEQQTACRALSEILAKMAVVQAWRAVLHQLEKEAARRALAEVLAGKWKAGKDYVGGLQHAMGWAFETMLRGDEK